MSEGYISLPKCDSHLNINVVILKIFFFFGARLKEREKGRDRKRGMCRSDESLTSHLKENVTSGTHQEHLTAMINNVKARSQFGLVVKRIKNASMYVQKCCFKKRERENKWINGRSKSYAGQFGIAVGLCGCCVRACVIQSGSICGSAEWRRSAG